MNPFLYSVAQTFYNEKGESIKDCTFIFPSRRAGLFFGKYLSQIANKPIFSPSILTIDDFISQLSGYAPADHIEMLFMLYKHYKEQTGSAETFDDFLYWGDILLSDFDDVDKYLVDASKLFSNLYDIKEIDSNFKDVLSAEQYEFLSRFSNNFNYKGDEEGSKKAFIVLWEKMFALYKSLRNDLHDNCTAYNGMMLRSILDRIETFKLSKDDIERRYKNIVFVGFNILSVAEEQVMLKLKDMGLADFYWDCNSPVFRDSYSLAGEAMSLNLQKFPSKLNLNEKEINSFPEIEVISVPSNVGQTRCAGKTISDLLESNTSADPFKSVVVLPNERLLMPMLYALPKEVSAVNITMGYPFSATPLYSLLSLLINLYLKSRKSDNINARFYFRYLLPILQHPYIKQMYGKTVSEFEAEIKKRNMVYVSQKDMPEELQYLFKPVATNNEALDYIDSILEKLAGDLQEDTAITKEFIYHYKTVVQRVRGIVANEDIEVATLFRILDKMSGIIKIPFSGEPLSGLQIMGVLETRVLDFDNVIILSMNEGTFPADSRTDTFIPYNLRKGFGLSTYEQRDGMAEYYFYRLISRAEKVTLIHDTRTEGVNVGDLSRFVYQLKYQYLTDNNKLVEKSVSSQITLPETNVITIEKDDMVMAKLSRYIGGANSFSASAINTYIQCPLKFYLSSVEMLKEEESVAEDLEASTFGSIYHDVMQSVYLQYEGKTITKDILKAIKKDDDKLTEYINRAFAERYFNDKTATPKPLEGRLSLRAEIIRKMVKRTIDLDMARVPFTMLATELKVESSFTLQNGMTINVKGIIDRIDLNSDTINIIDYKSGKDDLAFDSIESLFDGEKEKRNKAVMQLFFYALLLDLLRRDYSNGKDVGKAGERFMKQLQKLKFTPRYNLGLYAFSRYFIEPFEWEVRYAKATGVNAIDEYDKYLGELDKCLSGIFDKSIPFFQAENVKGCEYCAFASMCRR